jgi:hypothetical protein
MNATTSIKKFELMRSNLQTNDLVPAEAVREFMELKTAVEAQIKATWKALESYMVTNGIKNLDCLTVAEKKSWKIEGTLPPRFYKQVLDTSRLSDLVKHGDKLPKGASFTMGSYLTKTNRKAGV